MHFHCDYQSAYHAYCTSTWGVCLAHFSIKIWTAKAVCAGASTGSRQDQDAWFASHVEDDLIGYLVLCSRLVQDGSVATLRYATLLWELLCGLPCGLLYKSIFLIDWLGVGAEFSVCPRQYLPPGCG